MSMMDWYGYKVGLILCKSIDILIREIFGNSGGMKNLYAMKYELNNLVEEETMITCLRPFEYLHSYLWHCETFWENFS
jgi:hypothetical protein